MAADVSLCRRTLLALGLGLAAGGVSAQGSKRATAARSAPARPAARWPGAEVELTVPFPAGGATSLISRALASRFQAQTAQPLRLNYMGGGGGTVGASYVAKAPADGMHLLMGGTSMLVSRATQLQLDVDLYEAFVPLALVAEMPLVLLINPRRLNARTWPELLAELRRKPARYRYASAGIGTISHLAGESFKRETGAMLEHVPYKGSGPAILDVAQGNADLMFDGLASVLPHLGADRVRAVMVVASRRNAVIPDVPTSSELGLDGFYLASWYGIFAPRATPAPVQQRIIEVLRELGSDSAVQADWSSMGMRWPGLYGEEFSSFVEAQMQYWAEVVRNVLGTSATRP